jgi:Na+-driven multidrug efflux pump
VREPETIAAGIDYLKILAISQVFSAFESVTAGAFNGWGRTIPPSVVGILLTGARVPLAYYLVTIPSFALNGVWWSITLSSILKGIVLMTWYYHFQSKAGRT